MLDEAEGREVIVTNQPMLYLCPAHFFLSFFLFPPALALSNNVYTTLDTTALDGLHNPL